MLMQKNCSSILQCMNLSKKILFTVALLFQIVANAQSVKVTFSKVNLIFHNMVGNQLLILDSNYTTPFGDTFSVAKFKFFVGNIKISCSDYDKTYSQYFLIDQNDSASQIIKIGTCDSLTNVQFSIGIDSAKNVSGVQTGALDPANGMFWTWNSGYIMAKLEGKSPQSKAPFGNITYHIGGFRKIDNAIRKISLPITKYLVTNQPSVITININVDLNKWFDGKHPIKIAEKPFCMSPGKMAMEIADNYANMFSIQSIISQ